VLRAALVGVAKDGPEGVAADAGADSARAS
jgi:hypothetical protein